MVVNEPIYDIELKNLVIHLKLLNNYNNNNKVCMLNAYKIYIKKYICIYIYKDKYVEHVTFLIIQYKINLIKKHNNTFKNNTK